MIGDLLLYLLVSDLRDYSDNELYEALELLLGLPVEAPCPSLEELREAILDQLESAQLDRHVIASWPERYCELLPPQMAGYVQAQENFGQWLEATPPEEEDRENQRLARFRLCLDLLDDGSGWKERSLAARGLGTLEEELFRLREDYVSQPLTLSESSPASVVAHRQLLEGFEIWQRAFRFTHEGKLDEAFDSALEASRQLRALQNWPLAAGVG